MALGTVDLTVPQFQLLGILPGGLLGRVRAGGPPLAVCGSSITAALVDGLAAPGPVDRR